MTHIEFAKIAAYIGTAVRKPLTPNELDVYFDLLGDLDANALLVAAKRVLLEHKYATFPSVAELRAAAVETQRGAVSDLTPAEAWALAWWVAGNCDPEVDGSFERACAKAKAPPLVVEAIRGMGLADLCYGKEPVGVIRGQFLKCFEQLQARDRRAALLPPAVREAIEAKRARPAVPDRTAGAIVAGLADVFAARMAEASA